MGNKNSYTLYVPATNDQNIWFAFVNESLIEVDSYHKLIVDFNTVDFMETDDFVVLACLIESFMSKGTEKVIFINGTKGFRSHITNIRFEEYWLPHFNREKFTPSLNRTTLCLWKVNPQMIYPYAQYAKTYFENFTENKDLVALASNMEEVFNNIIDHSDSQGYGYIISQYYKKNQEVSFSICDFGVGIVNSLNNYRESIGESKLEDWRAIAEAIKRGVSSKSVPHNRGFGLDNLMALVESTNGEIIIRSNFGYLEKQAGKPYLFDNMHVEFPGTLIKVRVSLKSFDDRDESEFQDFEL